MNAKTEAKIKAIDAMLYAIRFDLKDDRMWDLYSDETKMEIEREIARLERKRAALLDPQPPKPRKPKAAQPVDAPPASGNVASYEPTTVTGLRRGRGK